MVSLGNQAGVPVFTAQIGMHLHFLQQRPVVGFKHVRRGVRLRLEDAIIVTAIIFHCFAPSGPGLQLSWCCRYIGSSG